MSDTEPYSCEHRETVDPEKWGEFVDLGDRGYRIYASETEHITSTVAVTIRR